MTMKNRQALRMLTVSAMLGLVVAFLAAGHVAQPLTPVARVVVSTADLDPGTRLNEHMLSVIDWPRGSVPEGTFADIETLRDRVLRTSVQRGEPLFAAKLAAPGALGGLSAVITEGKRAMTVRVNDVVGVAGFALPGNYVDILVNARREAAGDGASVTLSRVVLEQVLVLAVAQEARRDETQPRVVNAVTLEVSPTEAEKLDLARNVGTLSLVLRNQADRTPVSSAGVTAGQLLGQTSGEHRAPAPPPRPAPVLARTGPTPLAPDAPRTNCVEIIGQGFRGWNCF